MEKKKIYQIPQAEIVMIAAVSGLLDKTFSVNPNKTVDEEASNGSNIWDNNDEIWNSEE